MFEKLMVDTSRLIKKDGEAVGLKVAQKIKSDFVRSPITDNFVLNSKTKAHKQLMAKLEKQLNTWKYKDEILKKVNENNADAIGQLAEIKEIDGRFAYTNFLGGLAPKLTAQNQDTIVKIANIKNSQGYVVYKYQLQNLTSMITEKNKDYIIKTAETKNSKGEYIYESSLAKALQIKDLIKHKTTDISDSKILDYLAKKNLPDAELEHLEEVNKVLDVYHTFNKNYSCVEGNKAEYYNYIKNHPNLSDVKKELINPSNPPAIAEATIKDFANESRIEKMKEFCKENQDNEFSNHFYNEYYLKSEMVPKEIRAKCAEINEKFGTKVFLSNEHSNDDISLNYIKQELSDWQKASGGEAKMPTVLDFSKINRKYIDESSAYGQSCAGGSMENFYDSISIDGFSVEKIKHALRHEMTHLNDLKKGCKIPENYNLEEIMPKKKIKIKDVQLNEKEISVPDFENCKYKEEFYNAGVPRELIPYAYNNTAEFIAVASEGRMSQYSSGFKQMLVDFGMPEWMFKMKHSNKIEVDAIFDTILKQQEN